MLKKVQVSIPRAVVAVDAGNYNVKAVAQVVGVRNPLRESIYRHAVAPISAAEWEAILERSKDAMPDGYAKINGVPYVFGDAARRKIIAQRPRGASRYRRDYYGVLFAYALSDVFGMQSVDDLRVFASHAPADIGYKDALKTAAANRWVVERNGYEAVYTVAPADVLTYDEPLGGFYCATLRYDGMESKASALQNQVVLVIDTGGYTVDTASIDEGGNVDYTALHSTRTGTLDMLTDFEKALRDENRVDFQTVGDLDPRRVEAALMTGRYSYGSRTIKCKGLADEARAKLVNDIVDVINGAGGIQNYDSILLTGGGSALVQEDLKKALPMAKFQLASDSAKMPLANAHGGIKLAALLMKLGVLK